MALTLNELLLKVLKIIKYPNNKEAFVKEFEQLNYMEALSNCLDKLPKDVRDKIKTYKSKEEVLRQIPEDVYLSEIMKVSKEAFGKFLEAVSPLLTFDQKEKIIKLVPR